MPGAELRWACTIPYSFWKKDPAFCVQQCLWRKSQNIANWFIYCVIHWLIISFHSVTQNTIYSVIVFVWQNCVKIRQTIITERICSANFTFTIDCLSVWICEGSYNWYLETSVLLSYYIYILHSMKSWPSQISWQSPWFLEDQNFIHIKPLPNMLKPLL